MNVFTKYNRKNIEDRQMDTLIGISKGINANGIVDLDEAKFLQTWLAQNTESQNPIILNLFQKVSSMLEDDSLDKEEAAELFSILRKITGEDSELGEVAKSTNLPVCNPKPKISFVGNTFLFTGTCVYGTRKQCQQAIESLNGINAKSVTKNLDYLVLGTYVSDSWIHENYGRKIEKAMEYKAQNLPISIVTEEHWLKEANL